MNRINKVGYKTRVGVKIDEKGRYYHTGLFLDESRYNNTSMRKNGFDCSGYFLDDIIRNFGLINIYFFINMLYNVFR